QGSRLLWAAALTGHPAVKAGRDEGGILTRETHVATEPGTSGPVKAVEEVAGQVLQSAADVLTKPRARGWIHWVSATVAVAAGASLIAVSWPLAGLKAGLAKFVYTGA